MKIKLKNYARQLWLSLLLLVGVAAIAVPGLNGTNSGGVAKIGSTEYATLESAFAEVKDGETVTLLADVTLSGNLELALEGKSVTFDLDGKTLNGRTNLKSGSLTIQNGKIVATGETQALNVYGSADSSAENYSVLTIASNVIVDAEKFGVCLFGPSYTAKAGYGAVVNIAGEVKTVGTGAEGTVFVSGNLGNYIAGDMKNVINITGKVTSTNDAGVALNGNATVNVKSGAEITGNTGIAVKRGVLNVEDGATVHATGAENLTPGANNNGTEMTGAAISMTDTYNNYGAMAVNITGGTFTSNNTVALFKEDGSYTNAATFSVSGGTFSSAVPVEFCAEGYIPTDLGDGKYSVKMGQFVAQIGTTGYETLQAAVNAAAEDDEILILKDFTLTTVTTSPNNKYNVNVNKSVTINGDGHTITSSEGKRSIILMGDGKNITFKDLTLKNNNSESCLWIGDAVNATLDNVTLDGTKGKAYNQPLTIGQFDSENRVSLNITNGSVIKTNDAGTAHYSIIAWHPADITVTGSKLIGWANVYLKPDAAGSTVKIDGSEMKSQGLSGSSNNFAIIVTEGNGNTIEVKDTKIEGAAVEGTNQSLFRLGGKDNVLKFLGSTTYETNDMTWGCVTYEPGSAEINKIYFDETTKTAFAKYFAEEGGARISETADETGLYPLNYVSEVYYYWVADGVEDGGNYDLAQPFVNGWLDDGEFIRLKKDVTLASNLTWAKENASFTMTFGDFKVTKGEYSIALKQGVTVNTDKQTDIFSAADANFKVVETAVEGGYTYTVVAKEYVAQIGDEQKYYSLAEAFEAATDGQTITVLTDIDLPSTIAVTKQVTLDLSGKTISNTSDLWVGGNWSFFSVQANGNLTVTGDGTIDAKENDCFTFDVRDGGILTIKDGTYTGNISSVYLINEAGTGVSTCNIEGGTFSIKQIDGTGGYNFLLNCLDASYKNNTAKFNVTGGSFENFNPANNLAEGAETNFCAAGYEAVQDGNVWTVQKAAVAQIEGGAKYETLQAAINACEAGTETTIKLLDNVTDGAGFAIPDGVTNKNIIIDFDGKSYNVTKDAVGSGKTKTQAMHFYSGNTLTLKNGTITSAATSEENKLKMMMQNYCDLTLDGMTIDCSNVNGGTYPDYSGTAYEYWSNKSIPVFNFNTGNATIKNTTITFRDGDNVGLCVDGGTVALGEGVEVNGPVSAVTGTVTITEGKYSGAITADKATIQISGGIFTIEPAAEYCAEGFISVDNEDEATKAQYPYTVVNDDEYVFELIDKEVYELERAKTFKHVTYTRTFNNVNWQSLFVPFDINVEDYADKYEFAKIHMIAFEKDDNGFTSSSKIVVSYTKVTSGTLYANKPYLIKAKSTGTDVFVLENVTLKGCNDIDPIDCNTTHANYSIVGSYQPVTATAENPYMAMAGGTINWYQSTTISPFRWVIRVSPKDDDYARPNIEFVEDDDATGISTMYLNNDDIEGFYNVNGVRHDTPVKGINIVRYKNGQTKKVVIK